MAVQRLSVRRGEGCSGGKRLRHALIAVASSTMSKVNSKKVSSPVNKTESRATCSAIRPSRGILGASLG